MDFSQFFSDVLATIIGAGLALWGAICLDRRAHRRAKGIQKAEKKDRAKRVLGLISKELEYNLAALRKIDDNVPSTYRQLQIECWQAFSDGGELQSIDDPELLGALSTAYANTKHFIVLYNKFFEVKFFPERHTYGSLDHVFLNHTMRAKQDSIDAIEVSQKEITKKTPN